MLSIPFAKFAEGLEKQLQKWEVATDKFLEVFQQYENNLCFPETPWDGYTSLSRELKPWQWIENKFIYQGEWGSSDKIDGRGIAVYPHAYLSIGHYRQGKLHGTCIVFTAQGVVHTSEYVKGKRYGDTKILFDDGKTATCAFIKGVLF